MEMQAPDAPPAGPTNPQLSAFDEMLSGMTVDLFPMDLDLNIVQDPDQISYADSALMHNDSSNAYAGHEQNDYPMDGVGAGPLPTGFGAQPASTSGSTLTEFTKRRNWSQRVLDELKDFLYILTADGRFLYASPSCKDLTGYDSHDLIGKVIVDLIHPDDTSMFVREFHESIASGNPLRFFYRFRTADGTYAIFESHGHPHLASEAANFGPSSGATFCRGFFMMARPYPTKNAALLDSFLEHKIENERLRKRVAELKQEELEEAQAQQQHWRKRAEGQTTASLTESTTTRDKGPSADRQSTSNTSSVTPNPSNATTNYSGMPPPAKPSISNTALTRQNLNEALAASKPDSINDKMARYEGATHIETIEMLTGLRYREGERSHGISTGERSPALIRGDAGIAILVDEDGRPTTGSRGYGAAGGGTYDGSSDKKKKAKLADEYVCTDCGTLDSPEWRKGPNGPKTLCNACGLRWAKKEKRRSSGGGGGGTVGASDRGNPSIATGSGDSTPRGAQGSQSSPIEASNMAAAAVMGYSGGGMPMGGVSMGTG